MRNIVLAFATLSAISVKAIAAGGVINISSNIEEALIYVDGDKMAMTSSGTNVTTLSLDSGYHEIDIVKIDTPNGWRYSERKRLFIGNDSTSNIHFQLKQTPLHPSRLTLEGHTDSIYSVAFDPSGNALLSGSKDGTVKLWEVANGRLLQTFTNNVGVNVIAFSPLGDSFLTGGWNDNIVKLWNIENGEIIRRFSLAPNVSANSLAFSPAGDPFASGSTGNTLKLWDIRTGSLLKTFNGHTEWVRSVAFSPNGNKLVSGSDDGTVKLWSVNSGRLLETITVGSGDVYSVDFSPSGDWVLSAGMNGIQIWDLNGGVLIKSISDTATSNAFFNQTGKTILSSHKNMIQLHDANSGELLKTYNGHAGAVLSHTFSPDGDTFASATGYSWILPKEYNLKFWDID